MEVTGTLLGLIRDAVLKAVLAFFAGYPQSVHKERTHIRVHTRSYYARDTLSCSSCMCGHRSMAQYRSGGFRSPP